MGDKLPSALASNMKLCDGMLGTSRCASTGDVPGDGRGVGLSSSSSLEDFPSSSSIDRLRTDAASDSGMDGNTLPFDTARPGGPIGERAVPGEPMGLVLIFGEKGFGCVGDGV